LNGGELVSHRRRGQQNLLEDKFVWGLQKTEWGAKAEEKTKLVEIQD